MLARARQDRDDAEQRAEVERQLTDAGVRVIEAPSWSDLPKGLGWQVLDADGGEYTAETHAECEGHVAWADVQWVRVDAEGTTYTSDDLDALEEADPERYEALETHQERRWVAVYGCEDPDRHHAEPSLSLVSSDAEAGRTGGEPGRVESGPSRRVVIENNKA